MELCQDQTEKGMEKFYQCTARKDRRKTLLNWWLLIHKSRKGPLYDCISIAASLICFSLLELSSDDLLGFEWSVVLIFDQIQCC